MWILHAWSVHTATNRPRNRALSSVFFTLIALHCFPFFFFFYTSFALPLFLSLCLHITFDIQHCIWSIDHSSNFLRHFGGWIRIPVSFIGLSFSLFFYCIPIYIILCYIIYNKAAHFCLFLSVPLSFFFCLSDITVTCAQITDHNCRKIRLNKGLPRFSL